MGHNHKRQIKGKNLLITILLNFSITVAEVVGGLLSGSLSLLSDALHNLSDGVSIIISYFALKISQRDNNEKMTYGYKRAEILAALFNSSVLFIICIYLLKEAYFKFLNPEPINGLLMLSIAVIGLAANTFSVFLLKDNAADNINIKSAYMHLFADALSSFGVVFGGILIYFYNIYWIDPLITVLIAIYIGKGSFGILGETVRILMQGAPESINIEKIREEVEKIPLVEDIHHLHLWQNNDHDILAEFHIKVEEDLRLSQADKIRKDIAELLEKEFSITHFTIQMEYDYCQNEDLIKRNFRRAN